MAHVSPVFDDNEVDVVATSFSKKSDVESTFSIAENNGGFGNESKFDFGEVKREGPYAGMPKEILLQYSRQPKYVWARNIMAGLVVMVILLLISIVVAIIVISPACLEFWQTSPIYQIYPKSFMNSNNDSYGDLKGIESKLDYLNDELGVKALWLNPVYASPQADSGYDIKDFRDVDPIFGTMDDMEDLIAAMHSKGMYLIMDFIPNHSSIEHQWFNASSDPSHPDHEKYRDYYVWVDGVQGTLPNNWQTMFLTDPDAWTWHSKREQYYYHAFYKEQPDLNLWNKEVREELKEILRFWLKKGIDGFRCDALAFMLEAKHRLDNPLIDPTLAASRDNMLHYYTQDYKNLHDMVVEWREILDDFSTEPGVYRFMETEVYADISTTMRYYGTEQVKEADFPMNFLLVTADPSTDWNAESMRSLILEWMSNMPEGKWPNWVVSNHDNPRLPTRVGESLAKSAAFMIMTLPGTPGLYYGDEIGMTDNNDVDPNGDFRDPERTPMQWSEEENGGFCEGCNPWLPVNKNYQGINVESQLDNSTSMLALYKNLISLRQESTFQRGWFCMLSASNNILVYIRELEGLSSYLIAINYDTSGTNTAVVELSAYLDLLPTSGDVVLDSMSNKGRKIEFSKLSMIPGQSVVVKFGSKSMFSKTDATKNNCFVSTNVCYNSGFGVLQKC